MKNKSMVIFTTLSVGVLASIGAVLPAVAQNSTKTYVNVSTGFCLDSNAEGKVYALGCNGGNYQNCE